MNSARQPPTLAGKWKCLAASLLFYHAATWCAPAEDATSIVKSAIDYWRDVSSCSVADMVIHRPDWGGKNIYGFIEYFRNGVEESNRANYISPAPALSASVTRGELFTLARDYTALGLQVEFTPLFNLHANLINNPNDRSMFLQFRGFYDWRQDVQLMAGLDIPSGGRGTEYGGLPVAATPAYAATGRSAYLRAAYYF